MKKFFFELLDEEGYSFSYEVCAETRREAESRLPLCADAVLLKEIDVDLFPLTSPPSAGFLLPCDFCHKTLRPTGAITMKNAHRQSAAFRRAIHAEEARRAYNDAMRASVDFEFSREQDEEFYLDLSAHAPTPNPTGWAGLGA